MSDIYLKGIKKGAEREDIEGIKLELQKVKMEKNRDSTLLSEVTSRLVKMEKLVGGQLVNTSHILGDIPDNIDCVDGWFKSLRSGDITLEFSKPKEELRPIPNIDGLSEEEESMAEEYTNLEGKLKKAAKQNNKRRMEQIESKMNEIAASLEVVELKS